MAQERVYGHLAGLVEPSGKCHTPVCCGAPMTDDGGCSEGCCDDYKCQSCGRSLRVEMPD